VGTDVVADVVVDAVVDVADEGVAAVAEEVIDMQRKTAAQGKQRKAAGRCRQVRRGNGQWNLMVGQTLVLGEIMLRLCCRVRRR
jgi:hypothetical protein